GNGILRQSTLPGFPLPGAEAKPQRARSRTALLHSWLQADVVQPQLGFFIPGHIEPDAERLVTSRNIETNHYRCPLLGHRYFALCYHPRNVARLPYVDVDHHRSLSLTAHLH